MNLRTRPTQTIHNNSTTSTSNQGVNPNYVSINKCTRHSCDTCDKLYTGCQVTSYFNNYRRNTKCHSFATHLSCDSKNVVYLLTCATCGLQYVGETKRALRTRIYEHHRSARNPGTANCKIMASHFANTPCSQYGFNVTILEKIRDDLNEKETTTLRRERETFWIQLLKTKDPYGLNQKLPGCDDMHVHNNFNTNRPKNKKRGKRKKRKDRIIFSDTSILNMLDTNCSIPTKDLYHILQRVNKSISNKIISTNLENNLNVSTKLRLAYDICRSKLLEEKKPKNKNRPKLLLFFEDKSFDLINIHQIIHDPVVLNCWPIFPNYKKLPDYSTPMIIHKYDTPISAWIFNYRQTVQNLKSADFTINELNSCRCNENKFKDVHHGHIITGNLDFLNDQNLKYLFKMGPKYRLPKAINWTKTIQLLYKGLVEYISTIEEKFTIDRGEFLNWLEKIIQLAKSKIEMLQNRPIISGISDTEISTLKRKIRHIQNNFVITTIDKAGQNFAFICKPYYKFLVLNEIGYFQTQSNTYNIVNTDIPTLKQNLSTDILKMEIPLNDDENDLPFIQLIPKFHKKPIKFRPIIASKKAITKCVSKRIGFALKLLLKRHKKFCQAIEKSIPGINLFWIIDNHTDILNALKLLSLQNDVKTVETYDFTTLYTCLEHQEILNWLEKFLVSTFNNCDKIIAIHEKSANWCYKNRDGIAVDKNKLLSMTSWLLKNSVFICGDLVVRQNIGIPMGTDCAPYIANITLAMMEFTFIQNLIKSNFRDCRKLRYVFRMIDDITVFNDDKYFGNNVDKIYPKTLQLLRINNSSSEADVLDISINIQNHKAATSVFDKRDFFPFTSILYPHMSSNVSYKIHQNVFTGELLRILRVSSSIDEFIPKTKRTCSILLTRGHKIDKLKEWFTTFWRKRNRLRPVNDSINHNCQEMSTLIFT